MALTMICFAEEMHTSTGYWCLLVEIVLVKSHILINIVRTFHIYIPPINNMSETIQNCLFFPYIQSIVIITDKFQFQTSFPLFVHRRMPTNMSEIGLMYTIKANIL